MQDRGHLNMCLSKEWVRQGLLGELGESRKGSGAGTRNSEVGATNAEEEQRAGLKGQNQKH